MQEMLDYYRRQGAPSDQTALVSLLREVQREYGAIPKWAVAEIADTYQVKKSFLLAIIKRIPSLCLQDAHLLQLCSGSNCGRHIELAAEAEKLCKLKGVTFQYMGCRRMCGKGPNLKYDGKLYHKATKELLQELLEEAR